MAQTYMRTAVRGSVLALTLVSLVSATALAMGASQFVFTPWRRGTMAEPIPAQRRRRQVPGTKGPVVFNVVTVNVAAGAAVRGPAFASGRGPRYRQAGRVPS